MSVKKFSFDDDLLVNGKTINIAKDICTVVRLRRKNGQIVQNCSVYIGRACYRGGWEIPQSKWKNPFTLRNSDSIDDVCLKYYYHVKESSNLINSIEELRGQTLGCWCDIVETDRSIDERINEPKCHGEVLMRLLYEKIVYSS
jgi:hypothetical protein